MFMEKIDHYEKALQNISNTVQLNEFLISLSKHVADNHTLRVNQNYLYGCQSDLWIAGELANGCWRFQYDSNSLLVKGMCKVIMDCMDRLTSEQISSINFFTFRRIAAKFPHQKQKSIQLLINRTHNIIGHTT